MISPYLLFQIGNAMICYFNLFFYNWHATGKIVVFPHLTG